MSFVRDGHEQKLELWKQDRQKLQRWQRIQQIGLAASPLTLPAVKVEESAGIEELPKLEVKKPMVFQIDRAVVLEHFCHLDPVFHKKSQVLSLAGKTLTNSS